MVPKRRGSKSLKYAVGYGRPQKRHNLNPDRVAMPEAAQGDLEPSAPFSAKSLDRKSL
jgi:hypothetical protein